MNSILKNGYVAPYICFNFANGSITDYLRGKYFISFHQNRTADQAATFELELVYVPGYDGEKYAMNLHQMILASVDKPVTYQYGYITPNSSIPLIQDQVYKGMFTNYKENLNAGYMTYTISGVACSVCDSTEQVKVSDYLYFKRMGRAGTKVKPSSLVKELCQGGSAISASSVEGNPQAEYEYQQSSYYSVIDKTGIPQIMKNYEFSNTIQEVDNPVAIETMTNITDGTILEVFGGSRNADSTKTVGGFVYYSNLRLNSFQQLEFGQGHHTAEVSANKAAYESLLKNTQPFITFFDNVVTSHNSSKLGTFYYGPFKQETVQENFIYDYGNSYLNSDVISFDVSNDCTVAMATVAGLGQATMGVTSTGENVGITYDEIRSAGLKPTIYSTASGFDEAKWFTYSTLCKALNFPFEASMTVVGQLKCNHLLDRIHVTVMMNGTIHPVATGDYIITEIEDTLSESGFTTTFKLLKDIGTDETPDPKESLSTATAQFKEIENQIFKNDSSQTPSNKQNQA